MIRWNDNDRENLKKAVRNFNNKITRLEKLGKKNLPDKIKFKDLIYGQDAKFDDRGNVIDYKKFPILTRVELNRTIQSLRDFSKRGAEELITLKGGEVLTKWQLNNLNKEIRRAKANIKKEISGIKETKSIRGLGNSEIQSLLSTLNIIDSTKEQKGFEFNRRVDLIKLRATRDRDLRKALTFKDNFMYALSELNEYENVDLLYKEIENIKNPIKFYDIVSSSEILQDLFLFYKDKGTSRTYGGFTSNQEALNYAIKEIQQYKYNK